MKLFIRFSYHFFTIVLHLHAVFLSLFALIVGISTLITYIEMKRLGEALYLSFVTGLTIGYGDIVAKAPVGRLLAVLLGLIGIIFTGIMVAAAIRAVEKSLNDLDIT